MSVSIDPINMEACHWVKSNSENKKKILKLLRQKDSDKILKIRSKLKITELKSIGINNTV